MGDRIFYDAPALDTSAETELAAKLAAALDSRFALLALVEWLAVIAASIWISPHAWMGGARDLNPHVWIATALGGLIASLPVALALTNRHWRVTRHVNAACQMLMAGLLVHMTGGRIETHFAYFGLLAFLSFYRDWRVLVTATLVAGLDHVLRAALWPHSMYGVSLVSVWRPLEHAGWVLFEAVLLADFIRRSDKETGRIAAQVRDRNLELQKSEKRYRAIFECSPLPMWLCDAQTLCFLAVNGEAVRKYGFSREEFLRLRAFDIRPQEDVEEFKRYLAARKEGLPVRECKHKKKDGTIFQVETVAHVVEWSGREAILVLTNDISDRKLARQERDELELQLRHAQKLESIGQLAAGIAHEINTPTQYVGDNLTFLANAFEDIRSLLALEERLASECERKGLEPMAAEIREAFDNADADYVVSEIPKALEQALDGVARISTLVRAMKEFSHPGRKEKTPQDLNAAIENTVIVARNEWKYVADLHMDLDPRLPRVPCFLSDFNQVVLNLIVNAAHAIGSAASQGAKGAITIQTRLSGDCVEVRVSDTGTGIPAEIRDRIFEPFFTTKDVGKGTGQGLAISRSIIVDKHGGRLTFETEIGKGTTFVIALPVEHGAGASESENPVGVSHEVHSLRG